METTNQKPALRLVEVPKDEPVTEAPVVDVSEQEQRAEEAFATFAENSSVEMGMIAMAQLGNGLVNANSKKPIQFSLIVGTDKVTVSASVATLTEDEKKGLEAHVKSETAA